MRFILNFLLLLILISNQINARYYESQILEYNGESASLGLGGVSAGLNFRPGLGIISPASSADIEFPVLSLSYGDIFGYNSLFFFSYLHPTSYGVLSGTLRYFSANIQNQGLNNSFNLNLNFAKIFTEKLYVGLGINFLKADYRDGSGITLGANLGGIYHLFPYNEKRENKFLKNLRIGASILNIGNAISQDNEVISSPLILRLGPSVSFNIAKNIETIFSFDTILRKMKEFSLGLGLETIIKKKVAVRVGYQINSDFLNFTIGAGYNFKLQNLLSQVNYSFVSMENDKFINMLGINIYLGTVDNTAPKAEVKLNLTEFSPNYDGIKDYIEIRPEISDNKLLKYWEINILSSDGKVVRKYESPNIDVLEGRLTFKKVLTRLFERKKEAPVPDKILFDGLDDKGAPLGDGNYKLIVKAYDDNKNFSETKPYNFIIDKTPPEIKIIPEYYIFSPNGDGVKDNIKFSLDIKCAEKDKWIAFIKDSEGNIVKTYTWQGDSLKEIVWDGKNDNGELSKDGNYDIFIRGEDNAGNYVEQSIKGITLTTAKQSVAVSVDSDQFSPNNDNILDKVIFTPYVSDENGLERWSLSIFDKDNNILKSFEGEKKVPSQIEWNGKGNNNETLKDGFYFYKFEAWYNSGNHPESFPKQLKIDNTSPKAELKVEPQIFSPDGDNIDDIAKISISVEDNSDIKNWMVSIFEISAGKTNLFKKFSGEGKPAKEIYWNGLSDDGKLVSSKNKYFISFKIEDVLGNKTILEAFEIKINNQPPDVDFEFKPQLFSPDGDGENDELSIRLFSYDRKKIKNWQLNIYPIRGGKRESLFKKFEGENLPDKPIIWNGKNDKGELVESAMDYDIELIAQDLISNTKKIVKTLNVDVLVIKTPYGWKIKISNIEFEYNKADLKGNAFNILDRVIKILKKFPNYKIKIVGHTDNIGSRQFNLELSERRAKSVYDYLIQNGINREVLLTEGKAFDEPVAPNDTEEGRAKNRRVEFLLIKPGVNVQDAK